MHKYLIELLYDKLSVLSVISKIWMFVKQAHSSITKSLILFRPSSKQAESPFLRDLNASNNFS